MHLPQYPFSAPPKALVLIKFSLEVCGQIPMHLGFLKPWFSFMLMIQIDDWQ
jgi:hypothetical protein